MQRRPNLTIDEFASIGRKQWFSRWHDDACTEQSTIGWKVPQIPCILIRKRIDHRCINVGCQKVELLSLYDIIKEHGCHSTAAHCTRPHKPDAAVPTHPRVIFRNRNREAGRLAVAGLVTKPTVAETGVADSSRNKVKVMIDELTPLHEHVCV